MKISVIGDTHFGASYSLGKTDLNTQLNSRLIDFSNTFNNIIDNFIKRGVKLIVLTGDIFETRSPTSAQLNAFSKCIRRATDFGLSIVIVVGNHDQQRVISTTTVDIFNHLKLDKVIVFPEMGVHSIKDDDGSTFHLILMPYRDRRMLNATTNNDAINILKNRLNEFSSTLIGTKIVVGHFMLERTDEQENPDSFSINELVLPWNMFNVVDAVVMGHVHKHSVVLEKNPVIIYSGSMERVSFGEREHNKKTVVLDTQNITNYELIPTSVKNLIEINFDYSNVEPFKNKINDKIFNDIEDFCKTIDITNSILRIILKLKDLDMYYLNQQKIRDQIMSKNVENLTQIQVSSTSSRQLRNSEINEGSDVKIAMNTFIKTLSEPENTKIKLCKYAEEIIDEIEGK